jgi:aminoglycoside phosphotransferase family enzyme
MIDQQRIDALPAILRKNEKLQEMDIFWVGRIVASFHAAARQTPAIARQIPVPASQPQGSSLPEAFRDQAVANLRSAVTSDLSPFRLADLV